MLDMIIGGIRCKISLLFPAVLLLLLLSDRSGCAAFGFLAAVLHECGHMCVLVLLGKRPRTLTVSFFGMRMEIEAHTLSSLQEAFLYLGGPTVNILLAFLLFLVDIAPFYGQIHLVLAAVNLLPVLPLDGGQMLFVLLSKSLHADKVLLVLRVVFVVCLIPLLVLGGLVFAYNGNFTLLIFCAYLIVIKVFYKGN